MYDQNSLRMQAKTGVGAIIKAGARIGTNRVTEKLHICYEYAHMPQHMHIKYLVILTCGF